MTKLWSYAALLSCLGLALTEPVCSQEVRAVTGYVRSAMDSSVLSGVHVTVVGFPSLVLSDNSGRVFFGNLPRTELRMAFERIGLHADTATIAADWTTFTVYLRALPVYMDPVRAGAAPVARERFENLVQVSTVTLDPIDILRRDEACHDGQDQQLHLTPLLNKDSDELSACTPARTQARGLSLLIQKSTRRGALSNRRTKLPSCCQARGCKKTSATEGVSQPRGTSNISDKNKSAKKVAWLAWLRASRTCPSRSSAAPAQLTTT